jgi:hypothetical protein
MTYKTMWAGRLLHTKFLQDCYIQRRNEDDFMVDKIQLQETLDAYE